MLYKYRMQIVNLVLSPFFPGCHESCSECRGPGQQECVSCSDPTALLRAGGCVSECGGGFYSQDGVCYGKKNFTFPLWPLTLAG